MRTLATLTVLLVVATGCSDVKDKAEDKAKDVAGDAACALARESVEGAKSAAQRAVDEIGADPAKAERELAALRKVLQGAEKTLSGDVKAQVVKARGAVEDLLDQAQEGGRRYRGRRRGGRRRAGRGSTTRSPTSRTSADRPPRRTTPAGLRPRAPVTHCRDMTDTRIDVSRTIDAPTTAVFDVLSNPQRHAELDGSGFVLSDEKSDRITGTGQVFRMNMQGDHMGGEYQTDNTVTGYDENKLLAWQTAPAGSEPPGWEWVWQLDAAGPDSTEVRLSYDWSNVTDPAILQKVSFPLVPQAALEDSLARLAEAVSS